MKKYTQKEWLDIYNKHNDGTTSIRGLYLHLDGSIRGLNIETKYSGSLSSYGELTVEYIDGIEGFNRDKQFLLEEDGTVSIVVEADDILRVSIKYPNVHFDNPKTILFENWIREVKVVNNRKVSSRRDMYDKIEIVGYEVNKNGMIKSLLARITYAETYGCFGKIINEEKFEIDRDIIFRAYGMYRNDGDDPWISRSNLDDVKAYFTKDLDIVFNDDNKYHINERVIR